MINAVIYILIIYHKRPRIICSLFSVIKLGLTFTTFTPIDFDDSIARFKLIFLLNILRGFFVFMALWSIVPG